MIQVQNKKRSSIYPKESNIIISTVIPANTFDYDCEAAIFMLLIYNHLPQTLKKMLCTICYSSTIKERYFMEHHITKSLIELTC